MVTESLEEKLAHANAMFSQHARKMRKEEKLMVKWAYKATYYERKIAAKQAVDSGDKGYCQVCGGRRDTYTDGARHVSFPKGGDDAKPCKWCIKWLKSD